MKDPFFVYLPLKIPRAYIIVGLKVGWENIREKWPGLGKTKNWL
jgi:hypothetical protein